MTNQEPMHVYIRAACPWLDPHIKSYIQSHVPDAIFVEDFDDFPADAKTVLQWCDGWELTRNFILHNKSPAGLMNAYPNSDALARKDHLAQVADYWAAKRPDSNLRKHVPVTVRLTLDYAEYVDDSLMEADNLELMYSLEDNLEKDPSKREWWILKPALVDCGAGIRLFSTAEELASHLELAEYEDESDETEETAEAEGQEIQKVEEGENGPYLTTAQADSFNLDMLITTTGKLGLDDAAGAIKPKRPKYVFKENGRIPSSEMRAFVAQRYIAAVSTIERRKWHVRAYVLCVGRLKVYVFREMLALLAGEPYQPPWENPSLKASLTNTGLQDEADFVRLRSMRDFWTCEDDLLPGDWKNRVFEQICNVSAEVVSAAAHTMADKFTTMDRCFELFAADFLLDDEGNAWLLEVNETPAFYEHGVAGPISRGLMQSVVQVTLEHMGVPIADNEETAKARKQFVQVADETERLGKSNITSIVSEDEALNTRR